MNKKAQAKKELKTSSTFRLSVTCIKLYNKWSQRLGISQAAVIEQAVRDFDKKHDGK